METTNTPHYETGQFLAELLIPLAQNEHSVKNSFEAVEMIHKIPVELFDQGYRYISLNVASHFTNVSLSKTISVIIDRVYKGNIIKTKLRKNIK